MPEIDPLATQRDVIPAITTELAVAGFENAQEIGRGGFGVVYRCEQPSLDRIVAIKVLTSDLDAENLERFLREQRAMGRLSGHPNIVNIHQVGTTESGRPYIVMQYHPRGSLDARIHGTGPLDWKEALRVGVKLAGALEAAHRVGTQHRDVKPGNILLTDYGEPQLTDFGIARIAGGFQTSTGAVAGSPAFTAPEVLRGEPPTSSADIYGLGATLFCAVTGHAAFERRKGEQVVAQFLRITTQPIPDLRGEGFPDDVCAAIERAMAGKATDRPVTAAEFGDELREIQRRHGCSVDELALAADPGTEQQVGEGIVEGSTGPESASPRPLTMDARKQPAPVHAPPSPATKFRPPTPTRSLVVRDRLIETLRAGQDRRLMVIHAPAGFGKSTLAAQWRDVLTESGMAVAWLSVDDDDNNVVWFLTHLIEAIRRVRPAVADELGQALEEHGDEAERYILTSLIDEIHDRGECMAAVIDDWHRVTNDATRGALDFLLQNGCHHLQVIVTSRTQAGLPLSRMRVRDELVEIDSTALRFNESESRSFLVDLAGLELENDDVFRLRESTDGWVAALQLASLSLRGCEDPAELIGHMSGRHHAIGEYLAENVLDTLEPKTLEFLLATSVTERISGDLASALAGVTRGQAMLEEAEDRDLFLRRMDEDGEWFRYHHLFAQFLRRRLGRDRPDRVIELHRTASRWFADHEFLSEAVDHALAAGDQQRAVELVELDGTRLLEHSQMSTLLALIAKLPPQLAVSSPRLQIAVAWASELQRITSAPAALDRVYALLDDSHLPASEVADLRVEADIVKGAIEISADRIDGVDELVSECLARPDTLRPWVVSAAVDVATFVEIYRFDFAAARRWQNWGVPYHLRTSGPFSVMYGYCFAGIAAREQLDVVGAEENFQKAMLLAREYGGAHSYSVRLAGALLGELLYERNDVTAAERLLDESVQLGPEGGVVDFMLATYAIGARIKALRGDLESAHQRLHDGARTAEVLALPRLAARVRNEEIRWGLSATSETATNPRSSQDASGGDAELLRQRDGIVAVTAELREDSAIRILAATGEPNRIDQACTRAAALVNDLKVQGRPRALMQANLLLTECLAAAKRIDQAKRTLAPVAAQCADLGLVRLLCDEGPHVLSIITALRDDQRSGNWPSEWLRIPVSFLTEVLTAEHGF
ncbi:serine/threonine-protein kinase [Rhodococcus jostii]|uniref:Serine/threonine-protein kinase PknK n=1 Tax=Rhodococcus jostii TaxID=132919 RepID=A0A1H4JII6_RHOJO|nr:serine/threonine-protein kinase [Rhodococcus jostii]SEB46110.1 serine/threonine-protein kinase PknK [Rhodococcus jostii]